MNRHKKNWDSLSRPSPVYTQAEMIKKIDVLIESNRVKLLEPGEKYHSITEYCTKHNYSKALDKINSWNKKIKHTKLSLVISTDDIKYCDDEDTADYKVKKHKQPQQKEISK